MATGGTIPSNRTQKVTFYNTTGVLERDKNIYYVPRFSQVTGLVQNTEVRNAYLTAFAGACSSSSDYSEIEVSGWSPEDRTLVVKGNIDDFRLVSDVGKCLNYFILERKIATTSGGVETTKTYYYGFFVTGVSQRGGSSISITCEPDDFTNIFYLHNEHKLTSLEISGDYEPFNEKMKNCYVNRQHYNRVEYERQYTDIVSNVESNPIASFISVTVTLQGSLPINPLSIRAKHTIREGGGAGTSSVFSYDLEARTVTITFTGAGSEGAIVDLWATAQEYEDVLVPANMKVFLNQEESFKFRYQYRDLKYPMPLLMKNKTFTKTELNTIANENTFSNLSNDLRKKIVASCVNYLVVEFKSYEVLGADLLNYSGNKGGEYYNTGEKIGDSLRRPNPLIAIPFLNIPKLFKKYNLESLTLQGNIAIKKISNNSTIYNTTVNFKTELDSWLNSVLTNSNYADYILGAYVIPYLPIEDYVTVNVDSVYFSITLMEQDSAGIYSNYDRPQGLNWSSLISSTNIGYDYSGKSFDQIVTDQAYGSIVLYPDASISLGKGGFIVSKVDVTDSYFDIEETLPNLKNNYYDNVLECEPYGFYTMSYLSSNELVLNKNRYYVGLSSTVNFSIYTSVNNGVKIGLIPDYTVDNIETEYFNEGFSTIVLSMLPIISDSYVSYYYENLSRMKNQYAVNDYNRKNDLLQHFFISGPNAVGMRASRIGGVGALSETGNQAMQMVDEAIDWAQSNKVIEMNQKAVYADMGRKPDSLKQGGSDIYYDLQTKENTFFVNHYTIDSLSYNSIAKLLERTGYQVNLYDTLHVIDRVGWNFIKLNNFDFNPTANIMVEQERSIRKIFTEGVTLLHNKSYLTSGHNYEKILE